MLYWYFDESLREDLGFIIGAYVCSRKSIDNTVCSLIRNVGLVPGQDEFKSGRRMQGRDDLHKLREGLRALFLETRLGVLVMPRAFRERLGIEMLLGFQKIVQANNLMEEQHKIYVDEGIKIDVDAIGEGIADVAGLYTLFANSDSRVIAGIQLADLAAHSMGIMLAEEISGRKKSILVGKDSGYNPEVQIDIGFHLWASMRYSFFTKEKPNIEGDLLEGFTLNTRDYALYVSEYSDEQLRGAAERRFGTNYIGCIH